LASLAVAPVATRLTATDQAFFRFLHLRFGEW